MIESASAAVINGSRGGLVGRIGRGRIGELQRARIVGAMAELVSEHGVGNVAVSHVVERSGVSRRTFYELFEDREACFLAAFEESVTRLAEHAVPAYLAAGSWRERIRAGLAALLEAIEDHPATGSLCVVDALAGGPAVLARRRRVVEALVDVVHEGRRDAAVGRRPTRLVAEGVVGAVLSVLHGRLSSGDGAPMRKLLSPLTAMVVLPYLGAEMADRELARRAPRRRRGASPAPARVGDPLRELDMRLTYRTVRVLLAVSELGVGGCQPSSRQVADASGVGDQGQMSKLLWRLEHLGLIANEVPGHVRGEPNAWALTARGREVECAIRSQRPAASGPVAGRGAAGAGDGGAADGAQQTRKGQA
ncbi:MAG TPA: TetR/AcrR family transcriptional regulator [Solirubrobacteraceae bacterium]|nr:TetR/AcrR family transcriptional regulator [Solirubrobacteraceae bacterium]